MMGPGCRESTGGSDAIKAKQVSFVCGCLLCQVSMILSSAGKRRGAHSNPCL